MADWQACDVCGAVVADWTAHLAWHQTLTPASTPAPATATDPAQPTGSI